jgi:hypothetical protein
MIVLDSRKKSFITNSQGLLVPFALEEILNKKRKKSTDQTE